MAHQYPEYSAVLKTPAQLGAACQVVLKEEGSLARQRSEIARESSELLFLKESFGARDKYFGGFFSANRQLVLTAKKLEMKLATSLAVFAMRSSSNEQFLHGLLEAARLLLGERDPTVIRRLDTYQQSRYVLRTVESALTSLNKLQTAIDDYTDNEKMNGAFGNAALSNCSNRRLQEIRDGLIRFNKNFQPELNRLFNKGRSNMRKQCIALIGFDLTACTLPDFHLPDSDLLGAFQFLGNSNGDKLENLSVAVSRELKVLNDLQPFLECAVQQQRRELLQTIEQYGTSR